MTVRDFAPEDRDLQRSANHCDAEADRERQAYTVPPVDRIVDRLPPKGERGVPDDLTPAFSLSGDRAVLYERDRVYRLSVREIRIIIDVGKFRAVDENDLAKHIAEKDNHAIAALVRQDLVRRGRFEGPEASPRRLLTLTRRGHRLLRENRLVPQEQATYSGFVKPREASHDADLYSVYQKEAARIEANGGRVRRVALDFEIKRKINHDIAKLGTEARPEIAARHGLAVVRNKIPVPDMQIEYENADGSTALVNLELVTEHYRRRPIGDKARAGFSLYTPRGEGDHLRRVLDQEELTAEISSL